MAGRRQRGQALTEFLVAAVALVPLFLLIPLIAKYQDISHSTQMASRYVAFDAFTRNDSVSTWKSETQLAAEVRRRFFSNPDAPIKTDDVAGNFLANHNLFWRDPNGDVLIKDFGTDVRVSFGEKQAATHNEGFREGSDGSTFTLREPLQLRARGVYTANVSVALANMPAGLKFYEPFDAINLSVSRGTSVVVDPWAARSPSDIEAKIAASPEVFPAGALQRVSPIVNAPVLTIDALRLPRDPEFSAPKLGKLDFWRDVVPDDRLKAKP